MKDIIKSLFEASNERIKSPFVGSFIFAWVAFNWKPIVYLFSSKDSIEDRIQIITQSYESYKSGLVYPLLFVLFYMVVLPYIMWGLEELYTRAKVERLENKLLLDIQIIKNRQAVTKENIALEDIKAEYKEVKELNIKIEQLTTDLKDKEVKIEDLRNRYNDELANRQHLETSVRNLRDLTVTESDAKVFDIDYDIFMEKGYSKEFDEIASRITTDISLSSFLINGAIAKKLELEGLISRGSNPETNSKLTKKGKYFWEKRMSQMHLSGELDEYIKNRDSQK